MRCFLKILAVVSVSVFMTEAVSAQVPDNLPKLKEISSKKQLESVSPQRHKNGLWGYADSEGKFVIRPVFNQAHPYEGNVARVNVGGLWGIIGNNGLFVVNPAYDSIDPYSADSLAVVNLRGKYGLINSYGIRIGDAHYERMDYTDYGYRVYFSGKYGTVDKRGKIMIPPEYDVIEVLDKWRGLEQVNKDGKWGILKEGRYILTLAFDEKMTLLQSGLNGLPDLYLVTQGGVKGVVTSYGQYVVPCVYDEIAPSASGQYYVTRQGDRYGAVSLKMAELIPPILQNRPYIGEDVFKVYDGVEFYAVNHKGAVTFKDCSDLFYVFRPDDYMTTNSIPEWSKHILIEQNVENRLSEINEASSVLDVLAKHNYNLVAAEADETLPKGYDLRIPASVSESYGIVEGGTFVRSSGVVTDYEAGFHNLHYQAMSSSGMPVRFVSVPSTGEYLLTIEDERIPFAPALEKFNLEGFKTFAPKDFAMLPDDHLLVRFAMSGTAPEMHAVFTFSLDSLVAVSFSQLHEKVDRRLMASRFGGFYTCSAESVIADHESPLNRYDRNGAFDWEYKPSYGEKIYAVEETESYIYLCGSSMNASVAGVEIPIVIQLDKRGNKVESITKEIPNARFTGMICKDYLIYAKASGIESKDYYPYFSLDALGDNFGVNVKCIWESWGDGVIGGCGLVSGKGEWLYAPVLTQDQMCTEYGWEFSSFISDYLIVRHMGKYGLVSKEGELVVEAKYDLLESLQNPMFIKATMGDVSGVLDVSGKVIVPLEYDYVGKMSEDIIVVSKDGKFGCFDKTGSQVVPMEYDEIREYVGGMARYSYMGKFGFIDSKGEVLVAPFSDDVENFSENCTLVTIKNKVGFVTFKGEWLAVPMYDAGGSFSGGYAYLAQAGKYGYINKAGDFVIPMEYSSATDFDLKTGLARVAKNGLWGVINTEGNVIIPFEYSKVELCADGYIYVEKDSKCGIFSSSGNEIFPVKCDSIEISGDKKIFRYGVAAGRLDGQRIGIDTNGNVVFQYAMLAEK